ncbi:MULTISPECIES: hypothetical protein [unclassified Symbiopectobacterium]|uniref:hypothetical protein n=1 Tax=unclassified Symbiopectobacterium TaxID=2794573 RepID=UPI0022270D24|nr:MULTISPECIES: hypothetical protein [unclassified Symbiopectobacterium]MCW2474861.1 hypothetical protein [Candidatus Symbiopectobacterium sp. NZEC151]MCW2482924.1 hypothetical protein [Candidatus Symbiopectobacterium sp. NZEC135]
MHAWRKGHAFLALLEHKQHRAGHDKKKSEALLDEMFYAIAQCRREYDAISTKIAQLMSPGVLSRSEMYQRIRQQGVLMSNQQDITQRIIDLQNDADIEKQKIEQCQSVIVGCEKRHRNIARNLQRMRRNQLQRADTTTENDIEERVSYGDKTG